jgi:hypothetical protein
LIGWPSAISTCDRAPPCVQARSVVARRIRRELRHAMARQHLLDVLLVAQRDHRLERGLVEAGHAPPVGERGRHHDVDAVRLPADVRVDPVELHLELLVRVRERAEDAEAAGAADGRDDVAAVGEGEDRELDVEEIANTGAHDGLSSFAG